MLSEGFDPPAPGTSSGEMLPAPEPVEQPPVQPGRFEIPDPPWKGQVGKAPPGNAAAPPQPDALGELKRSEGTTFDPPPPPGPPLVTPPLQRPKIPPPDWRQEGAEP